MQQLLEFIPIILFAIAYFSSNTVEFLGYSLTLGNIYSATTVLMLATIAQMILLLIIYRKIEKRHWAMFIIVMLFGSLTLYFRNNLFILWKPTIANWLFASAFIFAPYFTQGQPLIKKVLGNKVNMPTFMWTRMTRLLIVYFVFMGILNLIVVYNFSEATWVSFKLWSSPIASILLSIIIVSMIYPYLDQDDINRDKVRDKEQHNSEL